MKIEQKTTTIKKMVETEVKVPILTIELSPDEALWLAAVAGKIIGGGDIRSMMDWLYEECSVFAFNNCIHNFPYKSNLINSVEMSGQLKIENGTFPRLML